MPSETNEIAASERASVKRGGYWRALYVCMLAIFVGFAVLAHYYPYFPADLTWARSLQSIHYPLFTTVMTVLTFLGNSIPAGIIVLLFAAGFYLANRFVEASFILVSSFADLLAYLTKLAIGRPRPSPDLVAVVSSSAESGFPSGHVVHYTVFYGFLFYLAYTQLQRSLLRTTLLALLAIQGILIGPSRVYLGAHWPSDVIGGHLWGGLLLVALIWLYNSFRRPIAARIDRWRGGANSP